jgi:hypothetical protein
MYLGDSSFAAHCQAVVTAELSKNKFTDGELVSDHPFLKRMAQKGTTGHGRISEKRVAKSLAAMLTPNSGALASAKGDMKRGKKKPYVVEAKKYRPHHPLNRPRLVGEDRG